MAKGNHKAGNHRLRDSGNQAKYIARQLTGHGKPRHGEGKHDGLIHSLGAERVLKTNLAGLADFLAAKGECLTRLTRALAVDYLAHRAEAVRQSQLNSDRQSLDKLLKLIGRGGEPLPVLRSELPPLKHNKHYTAAQQQAAMERQTPHNSLATAIARDAGLRSHELLTLRLPDGEHAADRRAWRPDIHAGREEGGGRLFVYREGRSC